MENFDSTDVLRDDQDEILYEEDNHNSSTPATNFGKTPDTVSKDSKKIASSGGYVLFLYLSLVVGFVYFLKCLSPSNRNTHAFATPTYSRQTKSTKERILSCDLSKGVGIDQIYQKPKGSSTTLKVNITSHGDAENSAKR